MYGLLLAKRAVWIFSYSPLVVLKTVLNFNIIEIKSNMIEICLMLIGFIMKWEEVNLSGKMSISC